MFFLLAHLCAVLGPVYAIAQEIDVVAPHIGELKEANLTCDPSSQEYKFPGTLNSTVDQAKISACNSCKSAIENQKQRVSGTYKSVSGGTTGTNLATANSLSGAAGVGKNQQSGFMTTTSRNVNAPASAGSAAKANLAANMGKIALECSQAIEKNCSASLASADEKAKEKAKRACETTAAKAREVATEKGMTAGELANLMGSLAQLGAALSSFFKPNEFSPSGSGISGVPDNSNLPGHPGTSNLGSSNLGSSQSPQISFPKDSSSNSLSAPEKNGVAAKDYGANSMSDGLSESRQLASTGSANSSGSRGGATSVSGSGMAGGAPGNAGSGSAESAKSVAGESGSKEDPFAEGSGGRGIAKNMLGINSNAEDLAAMVGAKLNDTEEAGDNLPLANTEEQTSNDNSQTIFQMIHSQIQEERQKGSI